MLRPQKTDRGFTLMELLIVVAIIAVLVAIAIPMFTNQLEKAREATDFANARSAYAEVMAAALTNDETAEHDGATIHQANGTYRIVLSPIAQQVNGWTTDVTGMELGGIPSSEWQGTPTAGGKCTISYDPSTAKTSIIWGAAIQAVTSVAEYRAMSKSDRDQHDTDVLDALEDAVNSMSYSELATFLINNPNVSAQTWRDGSWCLRVARSSINNAGSRNTIYGQELFDAADIDTQTDPNNTFLVTQQRNEGNNYIWIDINLNKRTTGGSRDALIAYLNNNSNTTVSNSAAYINFENKDEDMQDELEPYGYYYNGAWRSPWYHDARVSQSGR
jgi:type IV pilus assembly protein PilA